MGQTFWAGYFNEKLFLAGNMVRLYGPDITLFGEVI